MVHELLQEQLGIEGCRGARSRGENVLVYAAVNDHVEIVGMLTSAGVVDTRIALQSSLWKGRESSVKFLLQQWKRNTGGQGAGYPDALEPSGKTPVVYCIEACHACSPRLLRLLVDAGADTTTAVRLTDADGRVVFHGTPVALAKMYLSHKKVRGEVATESQLLNLGAIRRLLMRAEAVRAASWLWAWDASSKFMARTASKGSGGATKMTPTPLALMLPMLRLRAQRPRVILIALSR